MDRDGEEECLAVFFGHFIQKGHRTIPPRREVLHPLDCLFPSFIVALQFFPVVFHIVELFGQFLLSVRVLLNITLQFLNELFLVAILNISVRKKEDDKGK